MPKKVSLEKFSNSKGGLMAAEEDFKEGEVARVKYDH